MTLSAAGEQKRWGGEAERENERLREEMMKLTEKRAPVQGYSAGIPWAMHLRAYDAYCKMFSPQPAMIDLQGRNCRGGFHVNELDEFIPGWRDELSEITRLKARIAELEGKDQ